MHALLILTVLASVLLQTPPRQVQPPATRKIPVTDTYFGDVVVDDFQWLEQQSAPAVQQWIRQQNRHTERYLHSLPKHFSERLLELYADSVSGYEEPVYRGGRIFAAEQGRLVTMPSISRAAESEEIVDTTALLAADPIYEWFEPSPNGRYVAVSLMTVADEKCDILVFDLQQKMRQVDVIRRVSDIGGGDLAWTSDSTGFFYTRYPDIGERPADELSFFSQVWYHEIGAATDTDRWEFGKDLPKVAEIELDYHDASGQLLVTVQDGDGGNFAHYLRSPDGQYRQFSTFEDDIVQAVFGSAESLFLLSLRDGPMGSIVRMSTRTLNAKDAVTIVPHGRHPIVPGFYRSAASIVATETRLFVTYQMGGPTELRVFDHCGRRLPGPRQQPMSAVGGVSVLPGDRILFTTQSWLQPRSTLLFDAHSGVTRRIPGFSDSSPPSRRGKLRREFAVSKDGTRIPLTIISPITLPDRQPAPCIATGYGGYRDSMLPTFDPVHLLLLEAGCRLAVVHTRGGYEYGEDWYRAGMLTNTQHVMDDFAAGLQHLITGGYTTAEQLGLIGYSHGGMLVGAMLAQQPRLFSACVSYFGDYDQLRNELSPNGQYNVPANGSVTDPHQYRSLRDRSPYHHVMQGTDYPAALLITSMNDRLVDPLHSRKMAAALQTRSRSGKPILLLTLGNTGHFPEREADAYRFLLHELGVKQNSPAGSLSPTAPQLRSGRISRDRCR